MYLILKYQVNLINDIEINSTLTLDKFITIVKNILQIESNIIYYNKNIYFHFWVDSKEVEKTINNLKDLLKNYSFWDKNAIKIHDTYYNPFKEDPNLSVTII